MDLATMKHHSHGHGHGHGHGLGLGHGHGHGLGHGHGHGHGIGHGHGHGLGVGGHHPAHTHLQRSSHPSKKSKLSGHDHGTRGSSKKSKHGHRPRGPTKKVVTTRVSGKAATEDSDLPSEKSKPGMGRRQSIASKAKPDVIVRRQLPPIESFQKDVEFRLEAPGRVVVRLERLMGSDKVRLTDGKFMSTLLERLEEDEKKGWTLRNKTRRKVERTRSRHLAIEGLMEPTDDMPDLYLHPVYRVNKVLQKMNALDAAMTVAQDFELPPIVEVEPFEHDQTGAIFKGYPLHIEIRKQVEADTRKSFFAKTGISLPQFNPMTPPLDGEEEEEGEAEGDEETEDIELDDEVTPKERRSRKSSEVTPREKKSRKSSAISSQDRRSRKSSELSSQDRRSRKSSQLTPEERRSRKSSQLTPEDRRSRKSSQLTPQEKKSRKSSEIPSQDRRSRKSSQLTPQENKSRKSSEISSQDRRSRKSSELTPQERKSRMSPEVAPQDEQSRMSSDVTPRKSSEGGPQDKESRMSSEVPPQDRKSKKSTEVRVKDRRSKKSSDGRSRESRDRRSKKAASIRAQSGMEDDESETFEEEEDDDEEEGPWPYTTGIEDNSSRLSTKSGRHHHDHHQEHEHEHGHHHHHHHHHHRHQHLQSAATSGSILPAGLSLTKLQQEYGIPPHTDLSDGLPHVNELVDSIFVNEETGITPLYEAAEDVLGMYERENVATDAFVVKLGRTMAAANHS